MVQAPTMKKIEELLFDPHNPRLPSSKANASPTDILRYMLEEGNVTDLMLSISEQGYFEGEALLAIPSENQPGKFEVVEGNRRLAAMVLLKNPHLAPIKQATVKEIVKDAKGPPPNEVPVIIYPKREDVLLYLGYRHITGVDQWDSLAKARYLTQLANTIHVQDYQDKLKSLAKIIGSRKDYVHKLLLGYQLYKVIEDNNFYRIEGLNEEAFDFSVLTTATSYKGISNFLGIDEESFENTSDKIDLTNLKDLTEWMFKENEGKTRLGESRNLKTLNAVISSPRAILEFREGRSLEEARLFTSEPLELFGILIEQSLLRLKDALVQAPHIERPEEIHQKNLWRYKVPPNPFYLL